MEMYEEKIVWNELDEVQLWDEKRWSEKAVLKF